MRRVLIILCLLIVAGAFFWKWTSRPVPVPKITPPPAPPVAVAPRPPVPTYRPGERIGEIAIPRLKVAVPVFEGDDDAILKRGAGHVPHTALPGQPGNVCIAAHRDKFFRALRFIKPKDEIVLDTGQGQMRFVVNSTSIVNPTDIQVLLPGPNRDLTLVTCYPFYYVGHAPKRFIVHASRVPA